jgi:hypothetical protein
MPSFYAFLCPEKAEVIPYSPKEQRSSTCQRGWLPVWNQHADRPQAGGLLCSPVLILRRTGTGARQSGLPGDIGQGNSPGSSQGSLSSGTSIYCVRFKGVYSIYAHCVYISRYPQPPPSFVSVSASIQTLNLKFCLYQQVYTASTLICVCISKYPQPAHPILSVSAGIRSPHPHLYLCQQVSRASIFNFICISKYQQPLCSWCLYQQVSAASTYSTSEVRALSKEQRQCLFDDEQTLRSASGNGSGYSYSNCLVQCRLQHMHRLCHCAPYFYPTGGSHFVGLHTLLVELVGPVSCEDSSVT